MKRKAPAALRRLLPKEKKKGKNIVVFSRKKDKNLGDAIIGETCCWVLKKLSDTKFARYENKILLANFLSKDREHLAKVCENKDAIVFPGGGLNSRKFCNAAETIMEVSSASAEIYFNANGVSKNIYKKPKVAERLENIFSDERVRQITTRGDFPTAQQLIKSPKKYPLRLVLDPAIWTAQAYGVRKDEASEKIGIGLVRAEIFEELKTGLQADAVFALYAGILKELDKKGFEWSLFCNGSPKDYQFGEALLQRYGGGGLRYRIPFGNTTRKAGTAC